MVAAALDWGGEDHCKERRKGKVLALYLKRRIHYIYTSSNLTLILDICAVLPYLNIVWMAGRECRARSLDAGGDGEEDGGGRR